MAWRSSIQPNLESKLICSPLGQAPYPINPSTVASATSNNPTGIISSTDDLRNVFGQGLHEGCQLQCCLGLMVSTGELAARTTFSATDPINACLTPVWPCVPITIKPELFSRANR